MPVRKIFSALLCVLFLWGISCFFASSCLAAFSFSISEVTPTTITSKDQEVSVTLDIDSLPSESYFRVAWKKGDDSGSYFGYIKDNDGNWAEIEPLSSNNCSKYYKVSQTGNSQIALVTKIGLEKNIEQDTSLLRAHRFTATSCSGTSSTNSMTVQTQLATDSSPSPSSSSDSPPASSQTAVYKIKEVRDKNGNLLNSVKVYVDEVYTHHYAPETLSFCDSCKCDTADCNFGQHTIKLEKSGYNNWSETKDFTSGSNFEVNPEMEESASEEKNQEEESSSSPTPQPSNLSSTKPSSSPKTTAKSKKNAKPSSNPNQPEIKLMDLSDVLGEQDENKENQEEENKSIFQSKLFFPIILSVSGLLFISASFYPKIRPRILKLLGKK